MRICEHWLKIALCHIESHYQSCLPSTGAVLYNKNFPIVVTGHVSCILPYRWPSKTHILPNTKSQTK